MSAFRKPPVQMELQGKLSLTVGSIMKRRLISVWKVSVWIVTDEGKLRFIMMFQVTGWYFDIDIMIETYMCLKLHKPLKFDWSQVRQLYILLNIPNIWQQLTEQQNDDWTPFMIIMMSWSMKEINLCFPAVKLGPFTFPSSSITFTASCLMLVSHSRHSKSVSPSGNLSLRRIVNFSLSNEHPSPLSCHLF